MSVFVFIISIYLSAVNLLADGISKILPNHWQPTHHLVTDTTSSTTDTNSLSTLTSDYQNSLPDILIKNASYQNAAVLDAVQHSTHATTSIAATLVNIFCTYRTDTHKRTTTGSGFVIDEKGIVLTNAHVAQFLLLENVRSTGNTRCIIRTGNPATARYEAELLYISPAWIQKHANLIDDEAPAGTGERDYALLYLTKGVDGIPLPAHHLHLSYDTTELTTADHSAEIQVGGYPANKLQTEGPDAALRPVIASTTIAELFTFATSTGDIFSIKGSAVGASGSSGGPVVNQAGSAIGLISTKGHDKRDGVGSLRALTMANINRTIQEETGFSLAQNLRGDLALRATLFNETVVPFLAQTLEWQLRD